jgi:uncharacterized LabA/DUF88 family protein
MKNNPEKNIAFIDGQNLYLGTTANNWKVDLSKFRVYLNAKYNIETAYYFLGYVDEDQQDLYSQIQKSGFVLVFKDHSSRALSLKKGNVDTDIVFEMMKRLVDEADEFDKIVLVSGDGDYKKVVDYLVKKQRFSKVLFPNMKFASSLYKKLGAQYFDYLDGADVKAKIKFSDK